MAEEEKDDATYIVCLSVQMSQFHPGNVVEGSIQDYCGGCGKKVWLSKAGQKLRAEKPEAQLRCVGCIQKDVQTHDEDPVVQCVPGVKEEAIEHFRKMGKEPPPDLDEIEKVHERFLKEMKRPKKE